MLLLKSTLEAKIQLQLWSKVEAICKLFHYFSHIGILLEKMRREGYEFSVTPPEIVYKVDPKTKQRLEPIERISFEIEQNFQNLIM